MTPAAEIGAAAALLLAVLFTWSGVAKVSRPPVLSLAALGVPAPQLVARLLAPAEFGLAAALVLQPRLGGLLALMTLAVFSSVLARGLRAGVAVGCACFGASGRPLARADLARNALLAVAAGAAVAGSPVGPTMASVVLVTSLAATGAVVLALVELRERVGRVWDTSVETGPGGLS